ncbi:MAG: response regulator transcription factor [Defluviitaleaceae bacterium]|nr:response regulator transcription factor [Defluviitaleaceae bacterium]
MAHILIAEDDRDINELIARNLALAGHESTQVFDGKAAVRADFSGEFDLVLLDIMMPELDGFEVIKKIPLTPVIFITAKDGLRDKLNGLQLGADDYIVKPFEMLELLARVEAVLRRTKKNFTTFELEGVFVNTNDRTVSRGGFAVDLSPREFELLEVFIRNQNIALSRDKLLELAWGYDYAGETRTVDNHVQKLRSKLGWDEKIKTVYKLGYRLEVKTGSKRGARNEA